MCSKEYAVTNFLLGAVAAWQNSESNGFVITARIAGMNLNYNCTLVLVFMLRQTFNLVRSTRFGRRLPLDKHVIFHKFVGYMITVYVVVHTAGHVGNACEYILTILC